MDPCVRDLDLYVRDMDLCLGDMDLCVDARTGIVYGAGQGNGPCGLKGQ